MRIKTFFFFILGYLLVDRVRGRTGRSEGWRVEAYGSYGETIQYSDYEGGYDGKTDIIYFGLFLF